MSGLVSSCFGRHNAREYRNGCARDIEWSILPLTDSRETGRPTGIVIDGNLESQFGRSV